MEEFKIEKGIPVPARRPGNSKYPFSSMEVGDSWLMTNTASRAGARSTAANIAKAKGGWKFVSRKEKDGVRFWRVS